MTDRATARVDALIAIARHPKTSLVEANTAYLGALKVIQKHHLEERYSLVGFIGVALAGRAMVEYFTAVSYSLAKVAEELTKHPPPRVP